MGRWRKALRAVTLSDDSATGIGVLLLFGTRTSHNTISKHYDGDEGTLTQSYERHRRGVVLFSPVVPPLAMQLPSFRQRYLLYALTRAAGGLTVAVTRRSRAAACGVTV